ncbi:MAG TPA: hypothetical protein VF160_06025 [Candidatus Dormibacteraeota bacterium]
MLKFYPDHVPARIPRVMGDMLVTLWVVAWALCGFAVYQVVEGLQAVADGITGTGHTLDAWIESFRNAVPRGIPGVSSFFTGIADGLQRNSGDQLITFGGQAHQTIDHMAIAFGLVTAVPPILIVGGTYLFWRWRDAREMGSALAFVSAAERSGRLEQAKAVLAYRAVAQLRFTELMKASADPIGDLAAHQYDGLASAMLKRAGLESFRLYDRGAARLSEPSAATPSEIGDARQEDHRHRGHTQRQVGRLGAGDERR